MTAGPADADRRHGPVLEARGLVVARGGRRVLDDVDLVLWPGERVGIVGPNGAGKSTLLDTLVGLVRPRAGTVRVAGRPAARVRGRIAYLPQHAHVDLDHPVQVRDVVAMGRYPHRGPVGRLRPADRRAVTAALERVGMGELARVRLSELSGGQQQRTFLARALAQEADVLLLDEPTAGLDAATVATVERELARASAAGVAVVVVEHDLAGIRRGPRALVLHGRVLADGPPARALTPEVLAAAYGPGAVVLADDGGTASGRATGADPAGEARGRGPR